MKPASRLAAALLMLAAAHLAHAAADIRPGLWEFRSTRLNVGGLPDMSAQMAQLQQQLHNLPPETRRIVQQQMAARGIQMGNDGTVRSCITAEQARQDSIYAGRSDGRCTLTDIEKDDRRVRGRLSCSQPSGTADFETLVDSAEHLTTRLRMRSAQGEMQLDTDARWIAADCGAVSPLPGGAR